ncbi:zinc ribbon domain-containing protein, partial [Clostridium nigeriense]|uniref:zinc ribbon domain-containing protein n=1 Tax=Clostridium nigeriense TaxID=1805470 RepID=UPI003D331A19
MNKCPRCENENLKEDYNFCPICGLNLKEEERRIVIRNLKFMKSNYENAKANDSDAEEFREICIKTLEYAINELERTAQEVPVQEQLVTLEVLNNEL